MKTNTAINIKIPQGAELIDKTHVPKDLTGAYATSSTSGNMITASINMIAPAVFSTGSVILAVGNASFGGIMMFLSGVVALGAGFWQLMGWSDSKKMSDNIKKLNNPIKAKENSELDGYRFGYRSASKGYKVSQKVRGKRFFTIYNPLRLFKRILINETVWYDPTTDVHTIERTYANFSHIYTENEKFGGPRYSFRRALNSL